MKRSGCALGTRPCPGEGRAQGNLRGGPAPDPGWNPTQPLQSAKPKDVLPHRQTPGTHNWRPDSALRSGFPAFCRGWTRSCARNLLRLKELFATVSNDPYQGIYQSTSGWINAWDEIFLFTSSSESVIAHGLGGLRRYARIWQRCVKRAPKSRLLRYRSPRRGASVS